jgi:xanthine dehydrogenase accessory factor
VTFIRVTVAEARGSTPRAAGTAMLVYPDRIEGTIGGGALEWQAMQTARAMLRDGTAQATRAMPLGPALGQCCGGAVTLEFEADAPLPKPDPAPLWIWGAGHVGRAIVATVAPLNGFALTWIDTDAARFPDAIPAGVDQVIAAQPARLMPRAPRAAHHLILTYSHDLDLELCHAALSHGFASAGLIGSATKWARFRSRLEGLGHAPGHIDRIVCPIGDPSLGKEPQAIAIGVAARLMSEHAEKGQARAQNT